VFASRSVEDLGGIPAEIRAVLPDIPIVGGIAGDALFASGAVHPQGVLVALIGGVGVRATMTSVEIQSADLVEVVPAGARVRAAAEQARRDGFEEAVCLVFAPANGIDGEALAAAVRKGTGASVQLAGALMGGESAINRPHVFTPDGLRRNEVVLAGVFTRSPVGIAARYGWRAASPARIVTRSEGTWLVELDGRPAVESWLADVRTVRGASLEPKDLLLPPANRFALGLDVSTRDEPLLCCPLALRDDGSVRLAASIGEGKRVSIMRGDAEDLLEATGWASRLAHERSGGGSAGALILSCQKRLGALGDRFSEEQELIGRALEAPVAGACVFGEIARARRDIDAFHNMTAVVVAWPGV
jgi:hypothetical protein